jgi:putative flippase GtrA
MKNYLRTFMNRESASQITKVAIIGIVNTVVDFAVFNILREVGIGVYAAVTAALLIATGVSYLLNRHYTFQLKDGKVSLREAAQFLVVNLIALAVTLGIVRIAEELFDPLSRVGENIAKVAAILVILLPKFAAYRDVVFGKALAAKAADGEQEDGAGDGLSDAGSPPPLQAPPRQ